MKKLTGNEQILDACCGSKMFYDDKEDENVVFCDIRSETHVLCDGRLLEILPDVICDFTNQPFADESFWLLFFDPPHLCKIGDNAWMALKYGKLPDGWRELIRKGFAEYWRVCEQGGTIIFKWNEAQIKDADVIEAIGRRPVVTQRSGKLNRTIWMVFYKPIETTTP